MKNKILLTSDACFICERIKDIDQGYYILFNCQNGKYEVHNNSQLGSSYCFCIPFSQLDARTLDYTRKTQSQNAQKLIMQIDKENQKLQKDNIKKAADALGEILL